MSDYSMRWKGRQHLCPFVYGERVEILDVALKFMMGGKAGEVMTGSVIEGMEMAPNRWLLRVLFDGKKNQTGVFASEVRLHKDE